MCKLFFILFYSTLLKRKINIKFLLASLKTTLFLSLFGKLIISVPVKLLSHWSILSIHSRPAFRKIYNAAFRTICSCNRGLLESCNKLPEEDYRKNWQNFILWMFFTKLWKPSALTQKVLLWFLGPWKKYLSCDTIP